MSYHGDMDGSPFADKQVVELEAKLERLARFNAELIALAQAVAEHFAGTDAPLGIAARAAIEKSTRTPAIERAITKAKEGSRP